jgi:hypothetical protein
MKIWYNFSGNENRLFCPAIRMKGFVCLWFASLVATRDARKTKDPLACNEERSLINSSSTFWRAAWV